jgi:hypothetical protein
MIFALRKTPSAKRLPELVAAHNDRMLWQHPRQREITVCVIACVTSDPSI